MRSTIAVISLAALALLAWVGVARVAPAFERDLRARAVEAVTALGPGLEVRVEGRDVRVAGPLPAGATNAQVVAVLAALPGVGTVGADLAEASPAVSPEPEVLPARADVAEPRVPPAPAEVAVVAEPDVAPSGPADVVAEADVPTAGPEVAPEAAELNLAALEADEAALAAPAASAPPPVPPSPPTPPASAPSASPAPSVPPAASVPPKAADLAPPPASPAGGLLTVAGCRDAVRAMTLNPADRIAFGAPDSVELSGDGLAALRRFAAVLKRCPPVGVTVDGFHHDRGNPDSIRALTRKRAAAVIAALGKLGVDVSRYRPNGLGYLHPRYRNNDAERHLNERVEIKIGVK
jgi:outer membrane protein OmpA-like peptidoglycan-associated protein